MLFVTVVEKFASSPNAAANSFKVSSELGAESTRLATSVPILSLIAAEVIREVSLSAKDSLPVCIAEIVTPSIIGLVKVLFDSVCDPVSVTSPVAVRSIAPSPSSS